MMVWGVDGRTASCRSKRTGRPTGLAGGRQASGGSRLFRSASCWRCSSQDPRLHAVQWLPTRGRAQPLPEVCTSHPEIPEHCQG